MLWLVTGLLATAVLVVIVAATDIWVYADAQRFTATGTPVVLRIGGLTIQTPGAWVLGCLVLWIFMFPMYLVSRSRP